MTTIDYQADYRAAQDAGHHVDCDGYMLLHRTSVERVSHGAGNTYRAVCEECGPLHVGTFGQEADAKNATRGHAQDVPCDGRCKAWT
jgi:hypothetical protein